MIVLKANGQIARYLRHYDLDEPNNLCDLFWSVFCSALLLIFLGVLLGSYLLGWFAVFLLPEHWTAKMTIVLTFLIVLIGLLNLFVWIWHTGTDNQILQHGYRAIKDRYCPLVKWED